MREVARIDGRADVGARPSVRERGVVPPSRLPRGGAAPNVRAVLFPNFSPASLRRLAAMLSFGALLAAPGCAQTPAPAPVENPFVLEHCTLVAREGTPAVADAFKTAEDGTVGSSGQPVGYLATRASYAEFDLSLDLRWTGKPGNGGILIALGEPAADKVWPRCVQVQFKAGSIGELIPMDGFPTAELKPGAKSVPRAADAVESPAGEWNTLRVVAHADTIECWLNGKLACRVTQCPTTAGRLGLQLEGAPFEFRHVALRRN